ncbi:DUF924 family protein [Ramlibacter sp. USB13]|uniref:DUF924 family protein n=1 Tax=Ramlibacter cellulosilyticus TaxID=2764187 RepID=A0A923MSW8_9BURK|nr:DUF924 family protein [Ramlibacter cellulosilyticus]MBC5783574.1 DUF924 family protein [Ramlibacter cellulosilyticus]
MSDEHDPTEVLRFWRDAGPARWFRVDAGFDALFRDRFLAAHEAAATGRLAHWSESPDGALALVLLLDQFPRNAFRGTPRVYATDAKAREVADAAIAAGHDLRVEPSLRPFFYLPFMHSEELRDLDRCVALTRELGGEHLRFAQHHRGIVERFGRFPHRNAVLGRRSSAEEERFLAEGGFRG